MFHSFWLDLPPALKMVPKEGNRGGKRSCSGGGGSGVAAIDDALVITCFLFCLGFLFY